MTKPEPNPFTPPQQVAIDALASGLSVTAAAQAAGVTRQTVSLWLNQNPAFAAEVQSLRDEIRNEHREQLRALVPAALEVLEQWLREYRHVPAAVHILKATGLYGPGTARRDPE